MSEQDVEYAGFWVRVGATLIDTVLLLIIILPILTAIYGSGYWLDTALLKGFWDLVFSYNLPAVAVMLFWGAKSATPGKMALGLTIVDARTGGKPTTAQFVIRYIGDFVATFPLALGLKTRRPEPVRFEPQGDAE